MDWTLGIINWFYITQLWTSRALVHVPNVVTIDFCSCRKSTAKEYSDIKVALLVKMKVDYFQHLASPLPSKRLLFLMMFFENRRRKVLGYFHAQQIGNKQILKYLTLLQNFLGLDVSINILII